MNNTSSPAAASGTVFKVLGAISFSHFLNDTIQSLILASYPLFKASLDLSFTQIGLITLAFQCTSSLLQPLVGYYTDRRPKPFSLPLGMGCTLIGLLALSIASQFSTILLAAMLIGSGSAVFHPESTRVARMASGGRYGLAQSIFQVGGNTGTATGPLLAAWIILPYGQKSIAVFSLIALLAMVVLIGVSRWYRQRLRQPAKTNPSSGHALPRAKVIRTLAVLLALMFSKDFYFASVNSFLIFYLMHQYGFETQTAQYHLFFFLASVAVGVLFGGPIGDRIGRKRVIWLSILGAAPFTLMLPYVGAALSVPLTMIIGFMLASANPAILVFGQELFPARIGTVSGLFYGLSFGMAGIGAAVLGQIADIWGIVTVYQICAFLPLLGLFAIFLPDIGHHQASVPKTPETAKAG
ncbi:fosmidomycin resistance protein [Betaproteobacteria bacterium]|nr:fosmidomycin resistance protein [Betaproteobacteria bacterium]